MSVRKLLMAPVLLLVIASCRKDGSAEGRIKEKEFDLSGFTQVYCADKVTLRIEQGADFKIKARGTQAAIENLDIVLTNNDEVLDIALEATLAAETVEVTVTMPLLETATLTGQVVATVHGFDEQVGNVGFTMSGNAKATAYDGATVFAIEVGGNAELNLDGFTASLAGEVFQNGVVNAYGLNATRVYITTGHQSKAYVKPDNIFFGSAGGDSKIYYKGDPQDKELLTSGNGQIIKE